jgi:hypothetical protein
MTPAHRTARAMAALIAEIPSAPRSPRADLVLGAVVLLALTLLVGLGGCVTTRTPRGIALDFASYLKLIRNAPLSIRCQHVKDTQDRCERNGFPRNCAWNGRDDADDDDFTIKACLAREAAAKKVEKP